jgi:CheY-like chemotaxis protein
MDGWAFAQAYRALPGPPAPIVLLTASTQASRFGAELGAVAVLAKPFDLADLLAVVEQFPGHRHDGDG